MKNILILLFSALLFTACTTQEKDFQLQYDHPNLLYVTEAEVPATTIDHDVYVPAYSDLYYQSEAKTTYLTVVLSLRNISFTDTVYFNRIEYYSSQGKLLRQYISKVLVLRPMESMEFIVEESEKEGGAGANFVVSYLASPELSNQPFIETVMMGNVGNYGFAFSSPGVPINK